MRNKLCFPNRNWRNKYRMMLQVSIALYLCISLVARLPLQSPLTSLFPAYVPLINVPLTGMRGLFGFASTTALAAPIMPDPNLEMVLMVDGAGDRIDNFDLIPSISNDDTVTSVSIGNRVWLDSNGNGIQNADEAGVEGIIVVLLNANNTSDNTPVTDVAGNAVTPTITDSNGKYFFENLLPGDYQIQFDLDTLPEHHIVTEPNAINTWQPGDSDRFDSDVDPVTGLSDPIGPLMAGDMYYTLDLGILPVPSVEIGDSVWYDDDGDGIQSDGESGVGGVTITLFNDAGLPTANLRGNMVEPMVTDRKGHYLFGNLPPGNYYIQFDLTTLPEGYIAKVPDSTKNQQPITSYQLSTGVLSAGSVIDNLDMGIVPLQPIEIGDRVWYDNDLDGIQDEPRDEPGVHGVEVLLFNADSSPVTDMDGIAVGRTLTDNDGEYLFDNLPPGDYYVQFDLSSLPPDHVVTEQNATNPQSPTTSYKTDSDADPNSGRTPNSGFVPSGSANYDLDMGIHSSLLRLAGIDASPTAVQLISLTATEIEVESATAVLVEWITGSEINTFGFQILRSHNGDLESAIQLTDDMVLARGSSSDGVYEFIDTTVQAGQVYSYWLIEVQNDERVYEYEPVQVVVAGLGRTANEFMLFLPLIEK